MTSEIGTAGGASFHTVYANSCRLANSGVPYKQDASKSSATAPTLLVIQIQFTWDTGVAEDIYVYVPVVPQV